MATKQYNLGNVRGPQGADGKSAYEVAVENGFTGTESEFLASLIGPVGPKGDPGADGKDGTGVDIKGELSSTDDLPESGSDGEAYLIGGYLWVWDGKEWANAGNIQGPQGSDGKSAYEVAKENGFTGTESEWLASLVGPAGADGANGSDGQNGADGSAATIAIGSVVSGSTAAVSNAGTLNSAVLDFVIPRGEKGADGSDGAPGAAGSDGLAATISVGSVIVSDATTVENIGTSTNAVLNFTLEKGEKGDTGDPGPKGSDGSKGADGSDGADGSAATISVGSVVSGSTVAVENVGTSTNAVLNFTLEKGPQGDPGADGSNGAAGADGSAATIAIGSVTDGSTAAVSNAGTSNSAVLDFVIPRGKKGDKGDTGDVGPQGYPGSDGSNGADGADGTAATIAIGSVVSGSTAAVSNAGTLNSAVLDFVIPRGEKGADGSDGAPGAAGSDGLAATISVGSVIVSDATTVENVGTSTAAVLNFTLQQGPAGSTGPKGAPGSDAILTPATAASLGAVKIGSGISVTADGTISAQGGPTLNDMQFAYAQNAYIGASIPVSVVYTSAKGVFNGIKMFMGEAGFSISSVDKTGANADIILRTPAFFKRPGDYGCTIDGIKKGMTFKEGSIIGLFIPYGSTGTEGYTVNYDSNTGFIHINFKDCLVFSRGISNDDSSPLTITIPIHIGITGASGVGVAGDSFVTFTVPKLE